MANDFKRYTKANVTTSTGTSADAVYTVPSTGSVAMETVVIGIYLSNTEDATVPAGSTLEVISGGKLVVQGNGTANDIIKVSCSTATSLDATVSVLEDV